MKRDRFYVLLWDEWVQRNPWACLRLIHRQAWLKGIDSKDLTLIDVLPPGSCSAWLLTFKIEGI